MPNLIPYDLTFRGGLHVGTRGVSLEEANDHLPSDTLFAAFVDAWRCLGEDPELFARPFTGDSPDPPFLLTSAFPYAGQVRFFPMPPNLSLLLLSASIQTYGKSIKRTRYLSQKLVGKALRGEKLDAYLFPKDEEDKTASQGLALQGGALWLSTEEHDLLPPALQREPDKRHALPRLRVWQEARVPRVTVTRVDSSSTIYHAGRVSFAADCGLWFGINWRRPQEPVTGADVTYADAVARILAYLQDEGLGGERSSGYGAFTCGTGAALALPDPMPGQPAWLLSRYHPRRAELPSALKHDHAAYSLTSVAGWLRSFDVPDQRRKRLYLVEEGSIVCPSDHPAGDVADVRPDYNGTAGVPHPVYRYGFGLAMGLHHSQEASHA